MDRNQWRTNRKKKGWALGAAFMGILIGLLTMFVDVRAGFVILVFGVIVACGISGL